MVGQKRLEGEAQSGQVVRDLWSGCETVCHRDTGTVKVGGDGLVEAAPEGGMLVGGVNPHGLDMDDGRHGPEAKDGACAIFGDYDVPKGGRGMAPHAGVAQQAVIFSVREDSDGHTTSLAQEQDQNK